MAPLPKVVQFMPVGHAGAAVSQIKAQWSAATPSVLRTHCPASVPAPGQVPDLGAIAATLAASLARFKQPKGMVVCDALPRNTMGKVQKNELRATYARRFMAED